jgi:hypothetical protein
MFALPSAPPQAARCQTTTRFPVEGCVVLIQCISDRHHTGNCTMLDPNSYQPVEIPNRVVHRVVVR